MLVGFYFQELMIWPRRNNEASLFEYAIALFVLFYAYQDGQDTLMHGKKLTKKTAPFWIRSV